MKEGNKTKPSVSDALYWNNAEQRRVACEMVAGTLY